jgi:hypothetical protein
MIGEPLNDLCRIGSPVHLHLTEDLAECTVVHWPKDVVGLCGLTAPGEEDPEDNEPCFPQTPVMLSVDLSLAGPFSVVNLVLDREHPTVAPNFDIYSLVVGSDFLPGFDLMDSAVWQMLGPGSAHELAEEAITEAVRFPWLEKPSEQVAVSVFAADLSQHVEDVPARRVPASSLNAFRDIPQENLDLG